MQESLQRHTLQRASKATIGYHGMIFPRFGPAERVHLQRQQTVAGGAAKWTLAGDRDLEWSARATQCNWQLADDMSLPFVGAKCCSFESTLTDDSTHTHTQKRRYGGGGGGTKPKRRGAGP